MENAMNTYLTPAHAQKMSNEELVGSFERAVIARQTCGEPTLAMRRKNLEVLEAELKRRMTLS